MIKLANIYLLAGSVLSILFVFFFVSAPSVNSPYFYHAATNNGHVVFFFVLSGVFFLPSNLGPLQKVNRYLLTFLVTVCLGTAIELAQSFVSRDLDYWDIYRNLLGWAVASCAYLFWQQKKKLAIRFFLLTCLCIIVEQKDVYRAGIIYIDQQDRFPVLANFTNPHEIMLWETFNQADVSITSLDESTKRYVHAVFSPFKGYSSVTFGHFQKDWRNYHYLAIDILTLKSLTVPLCVKVTDKKHDDLGQPSGDRFDRCYDVKAGEQRIEISLQELEQTPNSRLMDLADMNKISLFVGNTDKINQIYIANIQLR